MTAIVVTYLILAPKLFTLAKKHVFITPTDFLAHRFQHRGLNLLATLIMVAALLNFYLAQLTAMGRAVEGLTTLPPDMAFAWGVAVLAAIMLLKLYQANPSAYSNYSNLNTGRILVIIGIVLNILSIIYFIYIINMIGWENLGDMQKLQERARELQGR